MRDAVSMYVCCPDLYFSNLLVCLLEGGGFHLCDYHHYLGVFFPVLFEGRENI